MLVKAPNQGRSSPFKAIWSHLKPFGIDIGHFKPYFVRTTTMPPEKKSYSTKIHGTLDGYSAWVFDELLRIKGESIANLAKYVIDRWVDDNADWLSRFGLTLEEFRESQRAKATVVELSERPSRDGS